MPPIQLVIFDMAGTTVADEHEVEACFIEAAAQTGLRVSPERILAMQGMAKRYVFDLLWREQLDHPTADPSRYVEKSYTRFTEVLEAHYQTQPVRPTEGCLEAFAYLRERRIPVALTTGFYRKVTDIILGRLGWLDGLDDAHMGTTDTVIQASLASDEVPNGRPHPDLIREAMRRFGVADPKAVVNLGDTPADLQSGLAAHVGHNLGLTNGTHTRAQLTPFPHHQLLGSLLELPDYLTSIRA
ncbi:MAG: HAD family hydrolase [Cytophagales bacterium]|nr:MAG: HAD family hydrolase [Cytophagales bacterium]